RYCPLWARPRPHDFVFENLHEKFLVGHPFWDCSRANSLNFGVPMEPETSELSKGLAYRIHSLGDVGCYNPSLLWAQQPHRHTSGQRLALIPNCHIPARAPTTSRTGLHHSTILSALGPDHAELTQEILSRSPILGFFSRESLNFGVLMEPKANELSKDLVLGRYANIHIRLTRSTPLGDVGCYIFLLIFNYI
ncbi:hypothetical protein DVH24_042306, partial [Malus domestica]